MSKDASYISIERKLLVYKHLHQMRQATFVISLYVARLYDDCVFCIQSLTIVQVYNIPHQQTRNSNAPIMLLVLKGKGANLHTLYNAILLG